MPDAADPIVEEALRRRRRRLAEQIVSAPDGSPAKPATATDAPPAAPPIDPAEERRFQAETRQRTTFETMPPERAPVPGFVDPARRVEQDALNAAVAKEDEQFGAAADLQAAGFGPMLRNPEFLKAFRREDGTLDPVKAKAAREERERRVGAMYGPFETGAAATGETLASMLTLGHPDLAYKAVSFGKSRGLSGEERSNLALGEKAHPTATAVGSAVGTALGAAAPVGPVAAATAGARALGAARLAPAVGFGLTSGLEHGSWDAGLNAAVFAGTAGAAGRFLKGADPGVVRRFAGEAAAVLGVDLGMTAARGEPIDWSSKTAQAALFGVLSAAGRSPLETVSRAKMRSALDAALPDVAPEAKDAYLEGDVSTLTPEQQSAAHVAVAPALVEHRAAAVEAAKAEAGLPARTPEQTIEAVKAGPEVVAKVEAETHDAGKVPTAPEPAAAVPEPSKPVESGDRKSVV